MLAETTGWLLDVYAASDSGADTDSGVVVWLLGEDGQRYQFHQPMRSTFYAAGPFPRLRALWRYVRQRRLPAHLSRTQREDLFDGRLDVMALSVDVAAQPALFRHLQQQFPDLDYYDADIPLSVQYAACYDVFPTLKCCIMHEAQTALHINPLDSRWQVEPALPPLRILTLEPDTDPSHRPPRYVLAGCGGEKQRYSLANGRLLLIGLQARVKRCDPDLILTRYGDTWLFPYLRQLAAQTGLSFHPSRDAKRPFLSKKAGSYFTYGMVLHRGEQTHLYGRWHIDIKNALMFNEYDVDGVLEQARVSGMPVQEMARRSPGAGITALQMITALRRGIMVPYTKQQAEQYKSARTLLRSDRGGLVFQPQVGLHNGVAEIDFVSMYPSIICLFNISPETVSVNGQQTAVVPELNMPIDQTRRGLLPETLQPILEKRIAIKARLSQLDSRDCRCRALKSRAAALKWLLVVAFGYAGYKRARFGRIEAHEAITAYSREAMLCAKEAAEALGYEVVHMYIDGLWVKRDGINTKTAVQPLLDEIERRTGLPIALEGFYKWIAFLPSKRDERIPVPNRYFGAFIDGALKVRGIELRRHDTPPFIAEIQRRILERLAQAARPELCLPAVIVYLRERLAALKTGQISPEALLAAQTLSRELETYWVLSPAARAAAQLQQYGIMRFPGQRIRFIFTRGEPGVFAWDLPTTLHPAMIDVTQYTELALRAAASVLQPWGIQRAWLDTWVQQEWYQAQFYLPG